MNKHVIKFLKKGIKADGQYYQAHYCEGEKTNGKYGITVYLKDINKRLPEFVYQLFNVQNETDSQTDYYETSRFFIDKTNPYFTAAHKVAQ